jgi:hypothetical protein
MSSQRAIYSRCDSILIIITLLSLNIYKHVCGKYKQTNIWVKVNQNLRESLFDNIELDNEIFFLNFSDEQMLVYLLNPASVRHVRVIGFYFKRSLELRTEVPCVITVPGGLFSLLLLPVEHRLAKLL